MPAPTRRPFRSYLSPLCGLVLSTIVAAPAAAAVEIARFDERLELDGQEVVTLDVPVGTLTIEGADVAALDLDVTVHCGRWARRCQKKADKLKLVVEPRLRSVEIRIDGYTSSFGNAPKVEVRLIVPRALEIEVEMGVGEVDITGTEESVSVSLGVGDVEIRMVELALGEVSLDVGVGSAEIAPRQQDADDSGFLVFGNEVEWDGGGAAEIRVDIGVGEATVRVD